MLDTMSSLIYGDDDFKDKDKPSSEKNVFFLIDENNDNEDIKKGKSIYILFKMNWYSNSFCE